MNYMKLNECAITIHLYIHYAMYISRNELLYTCTNIPLLFSQRFQTGLPTFNLFSFTSSSTSYRVERLSRLQISITKLFSRKLYSYCYN